MHKGPDVGSSDGAAAGSGSVSSRDLTNQRLQNDVITPSNLDDFLRRSQVFQSVQNDVTKINTSMASLQKDVGS
eukprot:3665841-Karenia_brevis.AAC.1